ncbi:MAG: amino acid ABC transporter permease [Phototrophicaceae bacterium]
MSISSTTQSKRYNNQIWLKIPYWLIAIIALGMYVTFLIATQDPFNNIFIQLQEGIQVTLRVSFTAYFNAMVIGLLVGLIRAYPIREVKKGIDIIRLILFQVSTFYVEILRGLPILVVLLIIAFVLVPSVIGFIGQTQILPSETTIAWFAGNDLGTGTDFIPEWRLIVDGRINITMRMFTNEARAIVALSLTYGAFLSEVFRAGIQSIGKGQSEAALSLGMTNLQTISHVILPQAIRRILPALSNDLIAMIKDSALVAILAVRDITQLAKLSSGQSFLYMETYLVAASIYLFMTLIGSGIVKIIENRLQQSSH